MELTQQLQHTGSNARSPQSPTAVYHSLIAAVIKQAIDDIKDYHKRMGAMYFILHEDCKDFCLELEIDHETLKDRAISLYENYKENHQEQYESYRVKRPKKNFSLTGFKPRLGASRKPAVASYGALT